MPDNVEDEVGQGSPVPPPPAQSPIWDRRTFLARPVRQSPSASPAPAPQSPEAPVTPSSPSVVPPPSSVVPQPTVVPPPTTVALPSSAVPQSPSVASPPPTVILPQAGSPSSIANDVANFDQADRPIATLPLLTPEAEAAYPLSTRTGEPQRPVVLMVAIVACWLSAACTAVAFGWWWWQAAHIPTFTSSARLLAWTHPDPVSALAIVMVMLVGLIGLLMVAAAGTAAYNSWAGKRWVRLGGLVCLAVTGLSFLLSWWFSVAMIPLAIGVVLLWLPPVGRFLSAMEDFHAVTPVLVPTIGIRYGPQPLIGHHG